MDNSNHNGQMKSSVDKLQAFKLNLHYFLKQLFCQP